MLTEAQKAAWLAALRDPAHRQEWGAYAGPDAYAGQDDRYCALGWLLRSLYGRPECWPLPASEHAQSLIGPCAYERILLLNDEEEKPLSEIADWIEANVECRSVEVDADAPA